MNNSQNCADDYVNHVIECAPYVEKDVARVWVEDVLAHEPDRIDWHVKRLLGFGGTDISRLVAEELGKRSHFGSARDVIAEKLCMSAVSEKSNDPEMKGHLERGNALEPIAREKLKLKYGLKPFNEAVLLKQSFLENGGIPEHPWMHGSEDDLLIDPKTNEVYLIDYKSPYDADVADSYMAGNVPLEYVIQLATYKMIYEKAGVKIDHLVLAPLHPRKFDVEMVDVYVPKKVREMIPEVGDKYWNEFVLKGKLPEITSDKTFNRVEELPKDVQRIVHEISWLSSTRSHCEKEEKRLKKELKDALMFEGIDPESHDKTDLGMLRYSKRQRESIDTDLLAKALIEERVNRGMSYDDAYDSVKDNPEFLKRTEYVQLSTPTGKNHQYANHLVSIKDRIAMASGAELNAYLQENGLIGEQAELEELFEQELSRNDDAPAPF